MDAIIELQKNHDWEGLPKHLLDLVLDKLEEVADWFAFISVCPSWRSAASDNRNKFMKLSKHRVPMLLVPNESIKHDDWSVYSVSDNKFISSNLLLPPYNKLFCGSSEGWLATLDKKFRVTLYKPFDQTPTMIRLPPLFPPTVERKLAVRYREFYVMKIATFTPDPIENPNDFICVVIFGEYCQLAYIRPAKDTEWTCVTTQEHMVFEDAVYYRGRFYAATNEGGKLVSFDAALAADVPSEPRARLVAGDVPSDDGGTGTEYCLHKLYLVESYEGELLQVRRYTEWGSGDNVTTEFRVFELVSCDGGARWDEIKSLGECALFLGDNNSVSVLALKFPGCEKNRIYFTHDKNTVRWGDSGPCDSGVYDLESGIVIPRFTIDDERIAKMRRRAPIFVLPS